MANLFARCIRIPIHDLRRGHDHSRRAITALQTVAFPEPFLHRMQTAIRRQALDRSDVRSVGWTANTVHDFTAWPSSNTVHAPQIEVSQPTCVPVSPSASRK
jgi:hypothetical protein